MDSALHDPSPVVWNDRVVAFGHDDELGCCTPVYKPACELQTIGAA